MRRLQRLRSSASALSTASPSSTTSNSFAASACRLHRDLNTTSNRQLSSRIATPSEQTWLATQRRSFSSSPQRRKDGKDALSTPETAELDDLVALKDYEEPEIETDLPIPRGFTRAPAPGEVTDPEYTPAQSGEGLEEIGGWADYWDRPNAWPISKSYLGFKPYEKVTDSALLGIITRRALVEALAVRQTVGQEALAESWRIGGKTDDDLSHVAQALAAKIEVAQDKSAQVTGPVAEISENVVGEEDSVWEENMSAEEARAMAKAWDPSWTQVSLADPWLKFAVLKRIQQLSGHVIPDAKQININTISALLTHIRTPPKAKKLAEELTNRGDLPALPNVSIYPRRVTPIDKEKMVGRWKVITKELEKRGLPVIGTGGQGKTVEHKWASGAA